MKKRTLFFVMAIVCGVIVTAVFFLFLWEPVPVFGFYRIPERTKTAIHKYLHDTKCRFIELDAGQSLAAQHKQVKKIDILFTIDGREAAELPLFAAEKISGISALPSPARSVGTIKAANATVRYGLPLLIDHIEIAYHKKNLFTKTSNVQLPTSLNALAASAETVIGTLQSPVAVAAGNDSNLLTLTGAVAEAAFGGAFAGALAEQLIAHPEITASDNTFAEFSRSKISAGQSSASLDDILTLFATWELRGIFHSQWSRMTEVDLAALMETRQTAIVILPFSRHRTLPIEIVKDYETLFIPSNNRTEMRQLVMPITIACTPRGKKTNQTALQMAISMITASAQEQISMISGLAPVHSTAEVSDIQASDVRFWCAATLRATPPLGFAVCHGTQEEAVLARLIRSRIAVLKMNLMMANEGTE